MLLAILAVVTATFQPPAPTVGDRITVTFAQPVVLDSSTDYEIVSQQGSRAVVRTFTPKPFALSGTTGGVRFRNLTVPARSVLKKGDDLKPAPLAPPRHVPWPRAPFLILGAAAAAAAAVWLLVARLARPARVAMEPSRPPGEVFRETVAGLLSASRETLRWARLADATRRYLALTRPELRSDLTTTEIVPRLPREEQFVAEILRQGDLEKFSEHGADPMDFDALATRALDLLPAAHEGEDAA